HALRRRHHRLCRIGIRARCWRAIARCPIPPARLRAAVPARNGLGLRDHSHKPASRARAVLTINYQLSAPMACCKLRYFSKALDKQTAANVILPEKHTGPFAVFYLLHGLSDDHTTWVRRTSIERYVENLPLLVVMPDGGRGFYCDAVDGFAYETALVRDLVTFIDQTFPTRANRGGRCIGGLSMGGYGAIKIALRFPELFCSATSHSGAFGFAHGP